MACPWALYDLCVNNRKSLLGNNIYAQKAQVDAIKLIKMFVQVADMGSFSAVARETGETPSSVSRQISRLEKELGTRLVQRTTRQQTLTEAGTLYLDHARQIIEGFDAAQRAVAELSQTPAGTLRVTAESDLATVLLSPLLPEFLTRYPDLRVQLVTSAALEDLIGRSIDVAIRVGQLEDSSLMARRLMVSRSLLVASPDYLMRQGTPNHPRDLSDHACLSFRVGPQQNTWRFQSPDGPFGVPITARVQAASLVFLRDAAKSGLGVAMLPTWILRSELEDGSLVPILPGHPLDPPATPVSAVYPSGRNLPGKVRVFVDFLADRLGQKTST